MGLMQKLEWMMSRNAARDRVVDKHSDLRKQAIANAARELANNPDWDFIECSRRELIDIHIMRLEDLAEAEDREVSTATDEEIPL